MDECLEGRHVGFLLARPNIVSKLSGLGTFLRRNDRAHIVAGRGARDAEASSAPNRCLFGSNFPIEKLWTSIRRPLPPRISAAIAHLTPAEREARSPAERPGASTDLN